jgi:acetyl esterase/lipase
VRHPQAVKAEALWALEPSVTDADFDIEERRRSARAEGLAAAKQAVDHVADLDADGVPCRLYRPRVGAPVFVHLHGGGFVFGDLETHDAHCRRLAQSSGWAVLAVDYRRAPEHRYPAASDDVDTVIDWLQDHGSTLDVDVRQLSVVGDSAGGQLALVAALRRPVFASATLVYPCLDPRGSYPSYRSETGGINGAEMDWFWRAYLADADAAGSAELSPLDADLSGLPPTLVITAEHDPLRDEGEALAEGVAEVGVPSACTRYLGMVHGFFGDPELFDASAIALAQVVAWANAQVGSRRST